MDDRQLRCEVLVVVGQDPDMKTSLRVLRGVEEPARGLIGMEVGRDINSSRSETSSQTRGAFQRYLSSLHCHYRDVGKKAPAEETRDKGQGERDIYQVCGCEKERQMLKHFLGLVQGRRATDEAEE